MGNGSIGRALLLIGLAVATFSALPASSRRYFPDLDQGVVANYSSRFGPETRYRLSAWRSLVAANRRDGVDDRQRLESVNRLANLVPFEEDIDHWGVREYWATPAEFVASHGGDCDDYSISKYFALVDSGVSAEQLRITYVTALSSQRLTHHMVLAYYETPAAEPVILDNLSDMVLPARQRPDLIPILSFNDADAAIGWRGERRGADVVRRWSELRRRMDKEVASKEFGGKNETF